MKIVRKLRTETTLVDDGHPTATRTIGGSVILKLQSDNARFFVHMTPDELAEIVLRVPAIKLIEHFGDAKKARDFVDQIKTVLKL